MRLFVALDIDSTLRERIANFMGSIEGLAPEARWVRPESLHVTLKFIGEQKEDFVENLKQSLREIKSGPLDIRFRSYGFFPNGNSARVFWVGMESGPELAQLANAVDDKTSALGVPREDRAFNPHLTLARAGGRSGSPRWRKGDAPNRIFRLLQEKLSTAPPPEFGSMTAREFFLFQSQLSPKGSKYTKLARFGLE